MGKVALFESHGSEEVERPEGVRTTWMSITPHWAEKVLDAYEAFCDAHPSERLNRPVHQARVNQYAKDMKAGKWGRHHQGIAFDKNNILMDGQHRLWAVVESDATVMMQVSYGLDREAQLTIDVGLARTTADVAAIAGFAGVTPRHVGVAKALARGVAATKPPLTRIEELELMREHWAAIQFVMELFPRKVVGIARAPVMAVLARAFYSQDQVRLRRFVEVLMTGLTNDDREHVIITLRNWLITTKSEGGAAALDAYGKTARALQAYLKGERIRTLYASKEELFRLPIRKK